MNKRCIVLCMAVWMALVLSGVSGSDSYAAESEEYQAGEQLYRQKCGNCHGQKGEGFLRVYPPIRNSRFLRGDLPELPCIMRDGLSGEITVGNRVFNQVMPGDEKLSEEEITLITDYMLEQWRHPKDNLRIGEWLKQCPGPKKGVRE